MNLGDPCICGATLRKGGWMEMVCDKCGRTYDAYIDGTLISIARQKAMKEVFER
jgi:hypothetical protein